MTTTGFEEIASGLRTGDLLLSSGKGFASTGIKAMLGCAWSHVGLVVREPASGRPLVFESTPCRAVTDVLTGEASGGVRLVGLRERLAGFDGAIAVRRLDPALAPTQIEQLLGVVRQLHGRPYEGRWLELLLSVSDRIERPWENLGSLFCSELIAEVLQGIGLLDDVGQGGMPSNEYTPHHFSSAFDLELKLGFALGPEVLLPCLAPTPDHRAPV